MGDDHLKDAFKYYVDGLPADKVTDDIKRAYLEIMKGNIMTPYPAKPPVPLAGIAQAPMTFAAASPDWGPDALLRMLNMRLYRDRLEGKKQFDFIAPYKNKDAVVVFLVHDGNPTYIEDDWSLFPSDSLITKLRLLAG